jgi:hypothetical protein
MHRKPITAAAGSDPMRVLGALSASGAISEDDARQLAAGASASHRFQSRLQAGSMMPSIGRRGSSETSRPRTPRKQDMDWRRG